MTHETHLKTQTALMWVLTAVLSVVTFFLIRTLNEFDSTKENLNHFQIETQKRLGDIQADVNLLKYQVREMANEIDKLREDQKFRDKIVR